MMTLKGFDYSIIDVHGQGDCFYWTTDPPTKEGWYWCFHPSFPPTIMHSAYSVIGYDGPGFYQHTHWIGPLPFPVRPDGL